MIITLDETINVYRQCGCWERVQHVSTVASNVQNGEKLHSYITKSFILLL